MPKPKWISKGEAARLCGLSVRQFDDAVGARLPDSARQGRGAKLRFDDAVVVATLVAYRIELAVKTVGDDDASVWATAAPDELAEKRRVETELLRDKLAESRGRLAPRQLIIEAFHSAGGAFRKAAERVQRKHGNEVGEAVTEMVDEYLGSIKKLFDESVKREESAALERRVGDQRDHGRDEDPPPARDRPVRRRRSRSSNRSVRRKALPA